MTALHYLPFVSLSICIFSECSTKGLSKDVRISLTPFFLNGELNTYNIPVGSTVNVTCAVTSAEYDVTSLTLALGSEDTVTVNTSSISLTRKLTEAGSPFWSCCVNQTEFSAFGETGSAKQEVAMLNIGYPPSRVEDFTCYSISLINLTCAWTVHPANSTGVNWTMEYGIYARAGGGNETHCRNTTCRCSPQVNGTRYTCTVPSGQFLEMENYSITVSGKNEYGVSVFNTSVYSGLAIATFPKLQNLSATTGSTWLYVTWQAADTAFLPRSATYRVTVLGSRSPTQMVTNNTGYNVTHLHPYSAFTVTVEARPYSDTNYSSQSVWSQPVSLTSRTEEDKPSSPPLLTMTGFNWWSHDSEPRLTVYWKNVPTESRNGIVTDYQLCYRGGHNSNNTYTGDDECPTGWRHVPGTMHSYTWSAIYPYSTYHVTVQAGTQVGYSEPNSYLIPSVTERHQVEYVTAERISPSVYNISWVTSQHDVDNVTVMWAFGTDPDDVTYFDWKLCPNQSVFVLIKPTTPKQQIPEDKMLWFGVALSSRNWTSGITWNQCIFGQGEATQAPLVDLQTTNHELIVTFQFSYCDSGLMTSRPMAYSVFYSRHAHNTICNRKQCTQGINRTIPATHTTTGITIGDLQQDGNYCVCMRIVYRNETGPTSVPVSVRLKNPIGVPSNATTFKIVGGVIGGLALVVLVLGLTECRKKLRMKYVIDSSLMERMENDIDHHDSGINDSINTEESVPKFTESGDSDDTPVDITTSTTDNRNATVDVSNLSDCTVSNITESTDNNQTRVTVPTETNPTQCIRFTTGVPVSDFASLPDSTGSNQTCVKTTIEFISTKDARHTTGITSTVPVSVVSSSPISTDSNQTRVMVPVETNQTQCVTLTTGIASIAPVPDPLSFPDSEGSNQTCVKTPIEASSTEIAVSIPLHIEDGAEIDVTPIQSPVVEATKTQIEKCRCPRGKVNKRGPSYNAILSTCSRRPETKQDYTGSTTVPATNWCTDNIDSYKSTPCSTETQEQTDGNNNETRTSTVNAGVNEPTPVSLHSGSNGMSINHDYIPHDQMVPSPATMLSILAGTGTGPARLDNVMTEDGAHAHLGMTSISGTSSDYSRVTSDEHCLIHQQK